MNSKELRAATPSERKISVKLTSRTVTAFLEKCYQDGTTPEEVLEGFINDLVDGDATRGSDERMYAQQYYERCGYDVFAEKTFCSFLLMNAYMDDIQYNFDIKDQTADDLSAYAEHPEEQGAEDVDFLTSVQREAEEEINRIYKEYADRTDNAEPFAQAVQSVRNYLAAIETAQRDGDDQPAAL